MRFVFLGLAVIGAIVPMHYFVSWLRLNGWDLGALVEAWNASDATTGLTYDLTIAAVVLTVWVIHETARGGAWLNLIAIPATFCIGVSCGLPLYLYLGLR